MHKRATVKYLAISLLITLSALVAQLSAVYASTDSATKKSRFEFLPTGHLFPAYLADPMRPTIGAQIGYVPDSSIENTSSSRFYLRIGGIVEIAQLSSTKHPDRGWQFGVEAGFNGQFDRGQSQDNIGWDGLYSLIAAYRHNENWAYRTGIHHVSSHVGDEFAERNGRTRINYTREEFFGAFSWRFRPQWRTYAELGWAYDLLGKDLQEEWRAQTGLEYEHPTSVWGQNWRPYAATNITAYEESDWRPDVAIQFGVHYRKAGRLLRIGLEIYDGRTLIGEFFQEEDRWISLGTWLDF